MSAGDREERTRAADELCAAAFAKAGCPEQGAALVAVGGYGRGELAPFSDLDVVLVLDEGLEVEDWAAQVWYPLWDGGAPVDHSVRTVREVLEQASGDLRVALGMLDVRHLAGDRALSLRLRTSVLTQWRRDARLRLGELADLAQLSGDGRGAAELAHASVPDLKQSAGGLRDAVVLKGLVAGWLVDVPHVELERSRRALLDVRDALHDVAGRATDRIAPEHWAGIAGALGLAGPEAAQRHLRGVARRLAHLSRLAWRRAESSRRMPPASGPRRPRLEQVAPGVAVSLDQEVVLGAGAPLRTDPLLLLRCAAEAAERDLVLAPSTASRLVREGARLPLPWPREARELWVRLLAAGPGLLPVWETLEETGALDLVLPEWERVRLLPHASEVHRFTVDRHMVETCVEAASLVRRVARPDVLVVAALLHDIGKGDLTEHCVAGEPIARRVAERIGFDAREVDLVGALVRRHLLLPETATTRDLDDPATLDLVTARLRDREELELLAALTEADARATSPKAWTRWRAGLVHDLVRRCAEALGQGPVPGVDAETRFGELEVPVRVLEDPTAVWVEVEEESGGTEGAVGAGGPGGSRVTVVSGDRLGLLADAAGMLALQRVSVRAARAWTQDVGAGTFGVSVWEVDERGLDAVLLRQRLEAIAAGRIDLAPRLARLVRRAPRRLEPTVAVRPEASPTATVLEVRADDRPGLVHQVCATLAGLDVAVRSAHLSTLGPQAVDVFYVQEAFAGALSEERAAHAAHALRAALAPPPER